MNVNVSHYYMGSNLARRVAFGQVIFWFASETLIALKYFHVFNSEEWSRTAFARRCLNTLSALPRGTYDSRRRFNENVIDYLHIYCPENGRRPYINSYAGKGAKHFQ